MTIEEITKLVNDKMRWKEEKVKILRKYRLQLLDEIHSKQQLLDRMDYMIYEVKKIYR